MFVFLFCLLGHIKNTRYLMHERFWDFFIFFILPRSFHSVLFIFFACILMIIFVDNYILNVQIYCLDICFYFIFSFILL